MKITLSYHHPLEIARSRYEHAVEGIRVKPSPGEQLVNYFGNEKFHLVFCNNALDHMASPGVVLQQMVELALPGGLIVVSGRTREGTNENWDGIHMHDLYIEDGKLIRVGRTDQPVDLKANLPLNTLFFEEPTDRCGDMIIVYIKHSSLT